MTASPMPNAIASNVFVFLSSDFGVALLRSPETLPARTRLKRLPSFASIFMFLREIMGFLAMSRQYKWAIFVAQDCKSGRFW